MSKDVLTYTKELPVRYETDVLIAGGGIAGISAALTAAELGVRVLLIDRAPMLGGNATMGGVANFCGNTLGQGKAFDTIVAALEEFQAIAPVVRGTDYRVFNHEILAVLLPELLARKGVRFLLHTQVADVMLSGKTITSVVIDGPSGLEAVTAKQYIDCTGDGFLALRGGFSVMKGENGWQLPMSYMYFVKHVTEEERKAEVADGWFGKIADKSDLPMTTIWPDGLHTNAVKIKVPMYDSTDTESLTRAEVAARRKMMSVLDYHQQVEKRCFALNRGSPAIGIREGVRIVGDYILTVDDLRAGKAFPDSVGVGTYMLDGHKPDDDKRTYILDPSTLKVPPYEIPFRCLVAKGCTNLLMGGRCISADQLALSSARVMTTCSMTGSASGAAAALAVKADCDVRSVPLSELQNTLVSLDAVLDRSAVERMLA